MKWYKVSEKLPPQDWVLGFCALYGNYWVVRRVSDDSTTDDSEIEYIGEGENLKFANIEYWAELPAYGFSLEDDGYIPVDYDPTLKLLPADYEHPMEDEDEE